MRYLVKDSIHIHILFRAPDTLSLWAIPHGMHPGQQPGDLYRTVHDFRCAYVKMRPRLQNWIWIGTPGWWGNMSKASQAIIKSFENAHPDLIPQSPYEWTNLVDAGVELLIPKDPPITHVPFRKASYGSTF